MIRYAITGNIVLMKCSCWLSIWDRRKIYETRVTKLDDSLSINSLVTRDCDDVHTVICYSVLPIPKSATSFGRIIIVCLIKHMQLCGHDPLLLLLILPPSFRRV